MTADQLAVWLYGARVAMVDQERGRLQLTYTGEALDLYELGVPLLSLSLPLRPDRYGQGVVRPFLDGLLPEGEPRQAVATSLGLLRDDTHGLIRALGRDCAGALVIQPADAPPPPPPTTVTAQPLGESELDKLVSNLAAAPLGAGDRVRVSLAGVQEKLLLARMPIRRWGRPIDGSPSTHILKPEIDGYPDTVENEAFCMRLAGRLGVPVPLVETATIAGRRVLIVERYDRMVHEDGAVERIHQEDFCQALGIPPERKYEQDGGPSLQRIAGILQGSADPDSLDVLLRLVTIQVLVGDGDAHAKNVSLIHERSGVLRLAPAYDLVCTLVYGDDRLAAHIDHVHRTTRVTADRLVNEAVRWGMARSRASDIVTDLLDRAPAAADAAREETAGVPDSVTGIVSSQLQQLVTRRRD